MSDDVSVPLTVPQDVPGEVVVKALEMAAKGTLMPKGLGSREVLRRVTENARFIIAELYGYRD